jgi:hypothetical protein
MEKKLTVKFQKLLGSPVFPPGSFVEALRFERLEGDTSQRRGTLFSLLTLTGPKEFDAPVLGRAIFDTLEEEYFADSSLPPLSALEKAAFSAHRRLIGMTLSAHLPQEVDFNLVLAVLWGQVLYLCRLGSAAVYLLRDGKVSEVYLGEEALVSCASGFVYGGDTLILGSKDFKTYFTADFIAKNLMKLEETMVGLSNKASLVAMVLKVEIDEYPTASESISFIFGVQEGEPRRKISSMNLFKFLSSLGKIAATRVHKFGANPPAASVPRLPWRGFPYKKIIAPLTFVLLLAVFIGSVFFTISRQSKIKLEALVQKTYAKADLDLVTAADIISVGTNDANATALLEKTLSDLRALERLGLKDPRPNQYTARAKEMLSKVSKENPVSKPILVYDFSLIEKNIKPTNLSGAKDVLYAASAESGAVYLLKVASPTDTKRVDGGKITAPLVRVSAFADQVFVLGKSEVFVIKTKTKEIATALSSLDSIKFADFASYNSNLYFLDSVGSRILRALYGEKGYSTPTNWLKQPVDLSKANSLALNGSVYVLLSDGKVLKFEGGKLSDFSLSGYTKSLGLSTYIYTGSGVNYIYLVDKDGKKIVQFDESGSYLKAYDFNDSEIASLSSIYVDPTTLSIYILSGSKVYEVKP